MNQSNFKHKDQVVRAIAGTLIIVFLVIQKALIVDMSICICCVGINLFQYGITGWCPFATYFLKIGWMQNR